MEPRWQGFQYQPPKPVSATGPGGQTLPLPKNRFGHSWQNAAGPVLSFDSEYSALVVPLPKGPGIKLKNLRVDLDLRLIHSWDRILLTPPADDSSVAVQRGEVRYELVRLGGAGRNVSPKIRITGARDLGFGDLRFRLLKEERVIGSLYTMMMSQSRQKGFEYILGGSVDAKPLPARPWTVEIKRPARLHPGRLSFEFKDLHLR